MSTEPPSVTAPVDLREFHPHACGLLFGAGELKPDNTSECHFVEAQPYSTPGSAVINAAGTVRTRRLDGTQSEAIPYENLNELVAHLDLTSAGTEVLLGRLRPVLSA